MNQKFDSLLSYLQISKGIDLSKYDDSFVKQVFQNRMTQTFKPDVEEYLGLLNYDINESNNLHSELKNSYTEFFRNNLTFSVLEKIILPSLLLSKDGEKNTETRIWSAACASGQEVYSLAILIEELKQQCSENLNYRIFASDNQQSQISDAIRAEYPENLLSNVSKVRIKKWFHKNAKSYQLKAVIKENIDFSVFDLFCTDLCCPSSSIYGDFDIVYCANIFFYYNEEARLEILDKVNKCLKSNGYIIVGEAEREILLSMNFSEVYPLSCVFRKISET